MSARDRDRDRRYEELQREVVALRKLLEATRAEIAELRAEPGSTPVGLAAAGRIAGISAATMYQHARRYGGWKVDPALPKSQWRFDPERVRQVADAAVATPRAPHRRRSTVELLPVRDRAA